jgi:hypothetical protein
MQNYAFNYNCEVRQRPDPPDNLNLIYPNTGVQPSFVEVILAFPQPHIIDWAESLVCSDCILSIERLKVILRHFYLACFNPAIDGTLLKV